MTPEEIARVRPLLLEFADDMLADALRRKDQMGKGELYLLASTDERPGWYTNIGSELGERAG